jgi:hypothetical protein
MEVLMRLMCWYQHIGNIKNNVNLDVILSFGMHSHYDAPTTSTKNPYCIIFVFRIHSPLILEL